ncbi:MAG: hypothetical protein ACKV0T_20340 [Planctomycetales bacterium]
MPSPFRPPVLTLLWCSLLVSALVPAAGRAQGAAPRRTARVSQSAPTMAVAPAARNVQNLPPGTILPPETVGVPSRSQSAPPVPAASGPVLDCDYWIVSSRRCKDREAAGQLGCLEYYHRTSVAEPVRLGRDQFLSWLEPDVPVCFVMHGSYNWWRDVVKESRGINRWIRSASPETKIQVVFYTWPSDGNAPYVFPIDIARLGRKSSYHAMYLAGLVGQLPPEQPVCLVGHSHGARTAAAALHLLGGGAVEDGQSLAPGYSTPNRLRAVLVAAAFDHDWLNPGARYGRALLPVEQVLLMRNSRDATLSIYPLRKGWSQRAIGKAGLGRDDRMAMDESGKKVIEMDAMGFAGSNHSFADYHERPELAAAIAPFVSFQDEGFVARPTPINQQEPPASAQSSTAEENPAETEPNELDREETGPETETESAPASKTTPAASGPKLSPVSLDSIRDGDEENLSHSSPRAVRGEPIKIYPKNHSTRPSQVPDEGQEWSGTDELPIRSVSQSKSPAAPQPAPKTAPVKMPRKKSTVRDQRNPHELRLEP